MIGQLSSGALKLIFPDFHLDEFKMLQTIATGLYGRIRLCQHKNGKYYAMKVNEEKHIQTSRQTYRRLNRQRYGHKDKWAKG
jgi:hypothetical protein